MKSLAKAAAIVLLLAIGLLFLAGTGPVLRLAIPTLQKAVSGAIDGSLSAEGLHGSLWTGLTLDSLALAIPATGLAVEGRRLELDWSPLALLRGVLRLDRLAAGYLAISLPHTPGPETPGDESAAGRPSLPLSLRLRELSLPHIDLADPRSGRRFSYALTAAGAAGQRAAMLSLRLVPLGEERDRLSADLAFDAEGRELRAEIDGRFDRKGLMMTLAGLPPEEATDLEVSLQGEGPADTWQGRLQIAAADLAGLGGDLGLQLDSERLGFTFSGTAEALGQLAADLPAQLQGPAEIGLAGSYGLEEHHLALTDIDLRKGGLLDLTATADLDLAASQLAAGMQVRVAPEAGALLEGAATWEALEISGRAEGDLVMPELDITLAGQSVSTPAVSSRDLTLTVRSTPRGDRLAVKARGTALGNDWTTAELANLLGDRLEAAVEGEIGRDFERTFIERLAAAAAGLRLAGSGEVAADGAVTAAELTADITDLALLQGLTGMELQGAGQVALQQAAWSPTGGGRAGVRLTTAGLRLGQADLDRLVGPQPELAGHAELTPGGDLTVQLDRVDLAMTDGDIALAFADGFTRMHLAADFEVLPGALPPEAGVALSETARLDVRLEGPPQAPQGEIIVTAPGLEAGGERLHAIKTATSLRWSEEAVLSLVNRADFTLREKPYRLEADLALKPDRLQLPRILLAGEGLEVSGQLELPGYSPPLRGTIDLKRLEAGLLEAWEVPLAAGRMAGTIDFIPEEAAQRLDLVLTARGLRLAGGETAPGGLERLTLRGRITDAFQDPEVKLQLQGEKIAYGQILLARLRATLDGPPSRLQATLETAGQLQAQESLPLSLSSAASLSLAKGVRAEIGRLTAALGTEKISLRHPLLFERSANGEISGSADLAVGEKGQAEGSWRLTPGEALSARVDVTSIPLGPWDEMFFRQGAGGILSFSANLSERAGEAAKARLSANLEEIRLARTESSQAGEAPRLPPLTAKLEAGLAEGRLDGSLSLGGPEQQILTADLSLPVTVSPLAGLYDFDSGAPLAIAARVDGEISRFWPYVPLPDHRLDGRLKIVARLSGSASDPDLEGTVELAGGRYEHLQFGTLLQDLRLAGNLDSRGVHISEIAATDGGKGTLTGKAEIEVGEQPLLAYDAEVTLRDMAVTRMDEMRLFGDIDLRLEGDEQAAKIRGEANVSRGEVDLAVALPPSVPQLEVENLPGTDEPAGGNNERRKEGEDEATAFSTSLQLAVEIPGRLFVRGKGLDSEWGGSLDIGGTAEAPQLVGELRARRGQLDLIGKTFAIRDSQITFLGGQPPDPQLDIVGVHSAGDIEVTATLTGTASTTVLAFSSDPQLPQDEILSRILFGKSQGRLTPYEAVQLAGVAANLTGTGGGLDIMGTIRKILRVDVLRVGGGEDGPSVEVGKYLREGVYVGTKRGATQDSSGVEVEIELTPHIRATTETTEADNKTGIQFKWDY